MKRVVFVAGATATGKSEWALKVAVESGACIVNCDSVQVYRGPVIGSNQPSPRDFEAAPHHLYGYVESPREITAGDYRRDFFARIETLPENAKIFVVGGTGFYFQAIEKGMFDVPAVPEEVSEEVRRELSAPGGAAVLWEELRGADPATAERLSPNDHYRLGRAVELLRVGTRPSDRRADFKTEPFPFPLLKTNVVAERTELRDRIRRRTRSMISRGLVDETKRLLEQAPEEWAPLRAVGYRETVRFLRENRDLDWLEEEISLRTVQLARRQETWFKRDREALTFRADGGFESFRESCLRFWDAADTLRSP